MIIYSSTIAFALSTTFSWASQVCSPEVCLDGKASSKVLAHDSSSSKYLTPGTYSDSSLSPSSDILNITRSSDSLTVSLPLTPIGFTKIEYKGSEDVWNNGNWSMDEWKSIYFPSNWYGVLEGGKIVWGAVPDKGQLPNDLTKLKLERAASAACDPPCSSHGVCIPSNTTSTGTCQCATGWTGSSCDQCDTGFWGPSCSPGPSDCTIWDDGLSGTGVCLGTASSSSSSCNCDHGTCTSSNQCICSAGWKTNGTVSPALCNTCAEGFFEDTEGNCLACPLGCDSCTLQQGTNATATCTSCSNSLTLSSANPVTCSATSGSCSDSTYYDESSSTCKSCSPACSTCTGPSTSDCLSCASPRVNLQGSCVYYDASTGICDSALSKLEGVFVVTLEKSECDACPSGCLDCHIPSFANTKSYATLQCSSCQEGYLLENAKCNAIRPAQPVFQHPQPVPPVLLPFSLLAEHANPPAHHQLLPSTGRVHHVQWTVRPVHRPPPARPVRPTDRYFIMESASTTARRTNTLIPHMDARHAIGAVPHALPGTPNRKGECVASNCGEGGYANGLGVCLSALVDKSSGSRFFWLFFLVLLLLGGGAGGFWWYVRRERMKTRQATKEFGDRLDDRAVQDNLRVLRLERVLGFQRVLTSDQASASASAKGRGYEEKRNKRFRELLLPSKRRRTDVEQDIELKSTNFANDRMTYGYGVPPPPYVPYGSTPSPSPQDHKYTKRDSLDSIPTPVLPSFVSPIKATFPARPDIQRKETGTTVHSMSSPVSPEYHTGLMPPPRPGMSRVNTQERERKREVNRRGEVQCGEEDGVELERRLRDLWPNLKRREQEGWI
uniref:EGF-like domain-containing protein n=1 Tax=Kwoniella bestiolae CBS 10118 TaxID=1296100 RepID=A0A1B9G3F8_9TREE|nr:hypothetical protein I302_05352 [Kwoniella bestiolae CBS 10118]OCF25532.1 hypothetical protein I302_05352 [Kwoniella bestiolae CBS 10118]